MKKQRSIFVIFLGLMGLISCDKQESFENTENFDQNLSFEEQIMAIPNNTLQSKELITAYSEVMKEVLTMSKESDFRSFLFENVVEANNNDNDYVFEISTMTKKLRSSSKFGKSSAKVESIVSKIQNFNKDEIPMIFFPKAETLEDNKIKDSDYAISKNLKEPVVVLKGAFNNDYSAPGYTLKNGKLTYDRMVTEEDAWNNDVYVIGNAENVSEGLNRCENMEKSSSCYPGGGGGGTSGSTTRLNGRAEYGGLIQVVSNLNEIEHWFSGKLEFRMIVTGVQGSVGTVIVDFPFPKIERKAFKDKKWFDYNAFLFNWNLSNLGDYNIEKWMERDGGSNIEVSISIPGSAYKPATSTTPAQPAFAGTTVKISSKRDDDDLGTNIVQFSDDLTQKYNLGKMNFKRK